MSTKKQQYILQVLRLREANIPPGGHPVARVTTSQHAFTSDVAMSQGKNIYSWSCEFPVLLSPCGCEAVEGNEILQAYSNLSGLSHADIVNDAVNQELRESADFTHVYSDASQAATISIYTHPSTADNKLLGAAVIGVHDPVGMQWLPLYRQEQCTGQLLVMWHRCLPPHVPSEPPPVEKRFFMSAVEKERLKHVQQGRLLIEDVCQAVRVGDQAALQHATSDGEVVRLLECLRDDAMRALFVRRLLLTPPSTVSASAAAAGPPNTPTLLSSSSLLFLSDLLNASMRQASNKHDYALCQALLHVSGLFYTRLQSQTTLVQHVRNLRNHTDADTARGGPGSGGYGSFPSAAASSSLVRSSPQHSPSSASSTSSLASQQWTREESAFSHLKGHEIFLSFPYWEHAFVEAYNRARSNAYLIYHAADEHTAQTNKKRSKSNASAPSSGAQPAVKPRDAGGRGFSVVVDHAGVQRLSVVAEAGDYVSADTRLQQCSYYRNYCRVRQFAAQCGGATASDAAEATNAASAGAGAGAGGSGASEPIPVTEDTTNEAFLSQHPRPTLTQYLRLRLHRHVIHARACTAPALSLSSSSSSLVCAASLSAQDAVAERIIRSLICSVLVAGYDVNAILQFMSTLSQTCHIPPAITQSLVPFWQRHLAIIYRYLPDLAEANIVARRGCWLQCLSPCGVPYFYDDVHNVVMYKEPEGWRHNQQLMAVLRRGGSIVDEEDSDGRGSGISPSVAQHVDKCNRRGQPAVAGDASGAATPLSSATTPTSPVQAPSLPPFSMPPPPPAPSPAPAPVPTTPAATGASPPSLPPAFSSSSSFFSLPPLPVAVHEAPEHEEKEIFTATFHFPSPSPTAAHPLARMQSHFSSKTTIDTTPLATPLRMHSVRADEYLLDDECDEFEGADDSEPEPEDSEDSEDEDAHALDMAALPLGLGLRAQMSVELMPPRAHGTHADAAGGAGTSEGDKACSSFSITQLATAQSDEAVVTLTTFASPSPPSSTATSPSASTSLLPSPTAANTAANARVQPPSRSPVRPPALTLPIQVAVDSSLSAPIRCRERSTAVHCVEQAVYFDPSQVRPGWKSVSDSTHALTALTATTPTTHSSDLQFLSSTSDKDAFGKGSIGNVFFPGSVDLQSIGGVATQPSSAADVWSSQALSLRARTRSVAAGLVTSGPRNAFAPVPAPQPTHAAADVDTSKRPPAPADAHAHAHGSATASVPASAPRILTAPPLERGEMEITRMEDVFCLDLPRMAYLTDLCERALVAASHYHASTNPAPSPTHAGGAMAQRSTVTVEGVAVTVDACTLTTASVLDLLRALAPHWTQPVCVGALMLTNYRLLFCPYGAGPAVKPADQPQTHAHGDAQQGTQAHTAMQVLHDTFCSIPLHCIHRLEVAAALDAKPKHTLAPPLGVASSLSTAKLAHFAHVFAAPAEPCVAGAAGKHIPYHAAGASAGAAGVSVPKSLLASVLPPADVSFPFINSEVSCHVRCKDQRQVTFSLFPTAVSAAAPSKRWKTFTNLVRKAAYPDPSSSAALLSSPTHPLSSLTTAIKRVNPKALPQLLAFAYAHRNVVVGEDGWSWYSPEREFHRQGALQSGKWQLSFVNQRYEFSPTYPAVLAVPLPPSLLPSPTAATSPQPSVYPASPTAHLVSQVSHSASAAASFHAALTKSKQYRSKGRLPVLTYYHRHSGAAILRAAQPLSGITRARSAGDEQVCRWADVRYIFDARPRANASANALKGGGMEIKAEEGYGSSLVFCDIENIHVMRGSLKKVTSLCRQVCPHALAHCYSQAAAAHVEEWGKRVGRMVGSVLVEDDASATPNGRGGSGSGAAHVDLSYLTHDVQGTHAIGHEWFSQLHESQWLRHLQLTLHAAAQMAACVHSGASVLCHCSDGWDRTSQLCMLAQLLLDPFYRTVQGFAVLIEKDFCSFGHKFADRCGHADKNYHSSERSPIFIQALDCVYQVMLQHPRAFEFQPSLLDYLVGHAYSCKYGTFLFNSERERDAAKVRQFTSSVWTVVAKKKEFLNPQYASKHGPLTVTVDPRHVQLWPFYYRWDITQKRAYNNQ